MTLNAEQKKARLEDYRVAVQECRKQLNLNPENLEMKHELAVALSNYAFELSNHKQKGKALENYKKAIELDPNYSMAYGNMGWCLYTMGPEHYQEAEAACKRSNELNPNGYAYDSLGQIYRSQGKYKKALEMFDKSFNAGGEIDEHYKKFYKSFIFI